METFETIGPAKVRAEFIPHITKAGTLVEIKVTEPTRKSNEYAFVLDHTEFKSFLKAGMRLDETLSGKLTPGELDPRD